MKLLCAGASHTGKVRSNNEDAILIQTSPQGGLFLVADGIGSREHGGEVSALLRDRYDRWWRDVFLETPDMSFLDAIEELKKVLLRVNREIVDLYGPHQAGSTLVLLFLKEKYCLYLSAGDSRLYLARGFSFQQITRDDTVGNSATASGQVERSDGGKLLGAVGIRKQPEFSVRTDVLRKGDRFLLCSDGVYRYLPPGRLRRKLLLGWSDPERLVEDFSREIERNGSGDNYSLIYVRVKATQSLLD